ncbi:alpha/beta fold hydrolase [bacterium]|nr:MAG: alpha/beta fold hydrolase [bacterium]
MVFLLVLFLAYAAFCYQAANAYLHPWRETYPAPLDVKEAKVGNVPVWATPGLLDGHPSEAVFVLAHGYGGTRATWNGLLHDLRKAGIDAVAPAMPGQDTNPDDSVGFGKKEARTIIECADWCRAKGAKKVVGLGVSLGGAATWLASAEDPKALDGVISDAAFALFTEAMEKAFSYRLPLGGVILRPVVWIAKAKSGIDPGTIRPIEAAAAWKGRPALVIQGTADRLIVPSNGERLAEAAGCPIWRVEGAEHAMDYSTDPEGYAKRVIQFARAIKSTKGSF